MYLLGISAYYHDSAAALIKNGEIIAAVQEERFSRKKQDASFPAKSVKYCLEKANIGLDEIDKIVFYDDPEVKFKRIKKTYFDYFPRSIPFFLKSFPVWVGKKQFWKKILKDEFNKSFNYKVEDDKLINILHHRSHAASAFFPSPFKQAAVLVIDGVGEFDTISLWLGEENRLEKIKSIHFPHSLGLLYSAITYYLGFKVNSGEYKVMGLAPYGEPKYVDILKKNIVHIYDNGMIKLDMSYFDFVVGDQMTNSKFHDLFNRGPREPESYLTQFDMDMARSIQDITEEIMIKLAKWAKKETKCEYLCLAGGVALNCVGNGKVLREGIFKDIWIQPAAGDAGGALGCVLDFYFSNLGNIRNINHLNIDMMQGSYLGPEYSNGQIEEYLKNVNAIFRKIDDFDSLISIVSDELVNGSIIGWHQGRMEFGPRALGNRSILGDPRNKKMQTIMNLKIKYRESFRPFAPSVIYEKAKEWFDLENKSPYMLLVASVKKERCYNMSKEEIDLFGIEKLNIIRSEIPSVTHVDYSARVQTVHKETNERYYKLIKKFEEKTGVPLLINTSFNVRGEPIVCTPKDSYQCFMRTEIDVLVLGDFLLLKKEQPVFNDNIDWRKEFQLD